MADQLSLLGMRCQLTEKFTTLDFANALIGFALTLHLIVTVVTAFIAWGLAHSR